MHTCSSCGTREVVSEDDMCKDCFDHFSEIKDNGGDEPDIIRQLRGIVESHSMGGVKGSDGVKHIVDVMSANAIVTVYDALSDKNKKDYIEKCGSSPLKMVNVAWKLIKPKCGV